MTDRDELARIIGDATETYVHEEPGPLNAADAILAAGYRKPRTITTETELDELPDGAVLRGAHGQISVIHRGETNSWPPLEVQHVGTEEIDFDYQYIALPATVLYVPEEQK